MKKLIASVAAAALFATPALAAPATATSTKTTTTKAAGAKATTTVTTKVTPAPKKSHASMKHHRKHRMAKNTKKTSMTTKG